MVTAATLSGTERRAYVEGLRRRPRLPPEVRRVVEERREAAMRLTRAAADRLRALGATRVMLFGSLARGTDFDEHSDIDLMVWGLGAADYLDALDHVSGRAGPAGDPPIKIDVVRGEAAKPRVLEQVRREGVAV